MRNHRTSFYVYKISFGEVLLKYDYDHLQYAFESGGDRVFLRAFLGVALILGSFFGPSKLGLLGSLKAGILLS